MENERSIVPAPIVAAAGWLVPGLGYWLLGERARALVVGLTILILFFTGVLVAGVRVIEVPGFDDNGQKIVVRTGPGREDEQWVLIARPLPELANKPWYVGQILAGPVNIICSMWSIHGGDPKLGQPYPKVKARLGEIGTLYTAVAGMLNLLAIIDSSSKASAEEGEAE